MKIGLVSRFPPEQCGIGIYSDNLYKGLKNNNVEVIRIGNLKSDTEYKIDLTSFNLKKELKTIIEKENLDLLHIQYIAPYFGKFNLNQNLIQSLKLKIPIIVTLHEVQYSNKGLKNKILRFIEKQIIKKSDKIVVHSPLQKEFLEKSNYTNIEHVLMGITPLEHKPKNNKSLLCFGIVSREKGHPFLINAMKSLKDHSLIIAGKPVDHTYESQLNNLIQENSLPNVIADFGWISEEAKDKYYLNSSMVILPYTWGPYTSAVIHDALSYNLPVVVTKVGAVWEIPSTYGIGSVISSESPEEIVKGIKDIEKNYAKYQSSIKKYRELADWNVLGKTYTTLYEQMVKNG
tara:strand:+ start:2992 stop:4029 length:1038 start_codon:yes stop_codon:yes gene_type:complete